MIPYVPRQSEKWARPKAKERLRNELPLKRENVGLRNELPLERENVGLRNELPLERENVGLRNELEPFWAWKCGAPEILVGMCRGKVKNGQGQGQGLRNELPLERENVGLQNELEPFWAWKCGAPERAWAILSMKMRGSGTSLIRFERENANLRNGH